MKLIKMLFKKKDDKYESMSFWKNKKKAFHLYAIMVINDII
jgi:hypothetical protein